MSTCNQSYATKWNEEQTISSFFYSKTLIYSNTTDMFMTVFMRFITLFSIHVKHAVKTSRYEKYKPVP